MVSEIQQGIRPFPGILEELPSVRKQKRWHLKENMSVWSLLALGQAPEGCDSLHEKPNYYPFKKIFRRQK